MTEEELALLKRHYRAISAQVRSIRGSKMPLSIDAMTGEQVREELITLHSSFPDAFPEFNIRSVYSGGYYKKEPVLIHLETLNAHIESVIESEMSLGPEPVTETRDFSFVSNADIREIIERDYIEAQKGFINECWKSVIILSGGMIEAILLDQLEQNETSAKKAQAAPKNNHLRKWHLADLIEVAVEIQVVEPGVSTLSHSVREYRNLVHPGNQLRNNLSANREEARIALEVLHMVDRDLS